MGTSIIYSVDTLMRTLFFFVLEMWTHLKKTKYHYFMDVIKI